MSVKAINSVNEFNEIVRSTTSERSVVPVRGLINDTDPLGQSCRHRLLGGMVWPVQSHLAYLRTMRGEVYQC